MTVCFFGHRDTPESVRPFLEQEIERLIDHGAECFLVGNQGRFDEMVLGCLRRKGKIVRNLCRAGVTDPADQVG